MKKILLIIACLLFTQSLFGREFIISPMKIDNPKIPLNISFLTAGKTISGKYLRVSILFEEIYPNIFIEEIIRGNTEGDPDQVKEHYYISGFDLAKQFGPEGRVPELKFNKWNSWNEFEMSDKNTVFTILYSDQKKLKISVK